MEGDHIRRLAAIFVDDFDLADWKGQVGYPEFIREVYFAHVDPDHPELLITTSQ